MRAQTVVRLLFVIRVCLWLIALSSTLYWMHLSNDLYKRGIFDPLEFSKYFRPVFYPCVITAFVAIGISFALFAISKHIKKKNDLN